MKGVSHTNWFGGNWTTLRLEDLLEREDFSYIAQLDTEMELHDEEQGRKSTWLQAIPIGEWSHPLYGKINVTKDRVKRFAANVNNNVRETALDIDYEHKVGVDGGRAAGWVVAAEARKDGLWIKVEFTARAAKEIKEGEWKYFSPEFMNEWIHPRTGKKYNDVLCGGGLTNRPFLKDIKPINLADYFDTPDGKYPQDDADYREASDSTVRCSNCAFFRGPSSCIVVAGKIDPDHKSKFFSSIRNKNTPSYFDEYVEEGLYTEEMKYVMLLREIPKSERDKMPSTDFAGKGKSFPIQKPEDVEAAAKTLGRAGPNNFSTDQIKRNIIRIARRKGAAYVAKLPKSWKMKEDDELNEFLKRLGEALGLTFMEIEEDASDERKAEVAEANEKKVFDELATLKAAKKTVENEDEAARKFAEQFPEQAKQLAEQATQLAEERAARKLTETKAKIGDWERGEKGGIPAAVVEPIEKLRVELSEDQVKAFDEVIEGITKEGLVELGERGATEQNRNGEVDPEDAVVEAINKKLSENKDLTYEQAYELVAQESPELFREDAREREVSGSKS